MSIVEKKKVSDKGKKKLSPQQKDLIFQYLACGETPSRLSRIFQHKYAVSIKPHAITYYITKYPEKINEYKEILKKNVFIIPSANKYVRLYIRETLIMDLRDNLWCEVPVHNKKTGEVQYDKQGNIIYQRLLKGNHGVINPLLDSQAKEMEEFGFDDDAKTDLFMRLLDRGDVAVEFLLNNSGNGNGRNGN